MEIRIEQLNMKAMDVFKTLASWCNDPEIRHLFQPNFLETPLEDVTPEELIYHYIMNRSKFNYLIWDVDVLVGEVSVDIAFDHLLKRVPPTGWISICVGNKDYWGKGVGAIAIQFIEEKCRERGLERIELGVFDYNSRARQLYLKLGYKAFARIEHFVYYEGDWHDDIRMEKFL